ncbi:hypothetical protein NKG94_02610 [Micromonospora sp. M12]
MPHGGRARAGRGRGDRWRELDLTGDLPEGKGLASSSADLVATVRAVGAAVGMRLSAARIESFLRHIEPSDGVMYDEIVAFYQRQVRLCRPLGRLPALTIVAHDEGGQVDTISHSRRPSPFSAADEREYARLLDELTDAVATGDLSTVGRISTRSAVLNSKSRVRYDVDALRRACHDVDGLGLVLAHSGTMLGVALGADDPELTGRSSTCVPRTRRWVDRCRCTARSVRAATGLR